MEALGSPTIEGLCYGGFAEPLCRRGFIMEALQGLSIERALL